MFGQLVAETLYPRRTPELDTFREPTDGTHRYRPWGAVPANPYVNEALKARQRIIEAEFQKLFDNPPDGTPPRFAEMLANDHAIGEERRKMKNFEGYMEWLDMREPITEELDTKIGFIEVGKAVFGETLDFAIETSVNNFEGGKVTHPYGQRLEHVEPFRAEAEEAVEARGGIVYPKVLPYHSITIIPDVLYNEDGTHEINGFIVRYKRDFGVIELPNNKGRIHLMERQLAGFRVDEASGFDQHIVERMLATSVDPERSWQKRYMQYVVDTGARGFIERAVQTDSLEAFVVPVSTTIYGYKELDPTGQRMAKTILRPTEDDGIAYFGPSHTHSKVPDLASN